jgi:hypothetical protein
MQDLQRIGSLKRGKALAALAIALAGCSAASGCSRSGDGGVPVACREGPAAVRAALARAPGPVTLGGGTPLSDCFASEGDAADVQQVGGAYLGAAAGLAAGARSRPDGPAALRLGYLMGAVRRGAGDGRGIYYELVRRLEQETAGVDTSTAAYRRGFAAGRSGG